MAISIRFDSNNIFSFNIFRILSMHVKQSYICHLRFDEWKIVIAQNPVCVNVQVGKVCLFQDRICLNLRLQ